MKNKLMVLMILIGLVAIPGILAEPGKEKYDIAITDYCYYEWTDYWGTSGIAVNVTYANKGNAPIPYPRLDTFQNDAVFTIEKYGDLVHGSAIRFAPLEPGEEFTQTGFFFPFYAYYLGSDRGQLITGRFYVDMPNEIDETDENNNFVQFDLFVEPGAYKKCKSKIDDSIIPPITTNDTVTPTTPTNATINRGGNFHSNLLIEMNIGHYKYINSWKYDEQYGTRNIANYLRHEKPTKKSYNSAEVIVFDDETKVGEYVKTKIKNAAQANYKVRQTGNVYFFSNPQNKHFIWQHGNYAIVVSAYEDVTPWEIMRSYLGKYPAQDLTGNIYK